MADWPEAALAAALQPVSAPPPGPSMAPDLVFGKKIPRPIVDQQGNIIAYPPQTGHKGQIIGQDLYTPVAGGPLVGRDDITSKNYEDIQRSILAATPRGPLHVYIPHAPYGELAPDVPPEVRSILGTIAGPESGNRFNVRYTPQGPADTFNTYADIKNWKGAPGPAGTSHAFGFVQFEPRTWEGASSATGIDPNDVSPPAQVRKGGWLAVDAYKRLTGRDLVADVREGKRDQVLAALRGPDGPWHTSGHGKGVIKSPTWTVADSAIGAAQKAGGDVRWMDPYDYLAMLPPIEDTPSEEKKGVALRRSLGLGEKVRSIPTLDVKVKDGIATIDDYDGRHRAEEAIKAGVDLIPVSIHGQQMQGGTTEIVGRSGIKRPFNFEPVLSAEEQRSQAAATESQHIQAQQPASPGFFDQGIGADIASAATLARQALAPGLGPVQPPSPTPEGALGPGMGLQTLADFAQFASGGLISPLGVAPAGNALRAGGELERVLPAAPGGSMMPIAQPAMSPAQRLSATEARQAATAENLARNIISQRFQEGTGGPGTTPFEAIQQFAGARREGQPLTLADIPSLRPLAGSVYRAGGEGRNIIGSFLTERDVGAGGRLEGVIGKYLATGSAKRTTENLMQIRRLNAAPLWDKALDQQITISPRLALFIKDPEIENALAEGWARESDIAVTEGREIKPDEYVKVTRGRAGQPGTATVSMKLMQVVKEGMDRLLDSAKYQGEFGGLNSAGRVFYNKRNAFVAELRRLNPDYGRALEQYAGDSAVIRAVKDGKELFRRRITPEEVADHFGGLSDSEKVFYRLGAADTLRDNLDAVRLSGDESKAIINSARDRAKLRPLFRSDEEESNFVDAVRTERAMFETGTKIRGLSPTAERVSDDQRLAGAVSHGLYGAGHLARGSVLGAGLSLGRMARELSRQRQLRDNPDLNKALARLLINPEIGLQGRPGLNLLNSISLPKTQNALINGALRWSGQFAAPAVPMR